MTKISLSILTGFVIFGGFVGCASQPTDTSLGNNGGNTPTRKSDAGGSSFVPSPSPSPSTDFDSGSGSDDATAVVTGDDAANEASGDDGAAQNEASGDDAPTDAGSTPPTDAVASCGPSTCNGCCDATGTCVGGNDPTACGTGGATCQSCGAVTTCQSGACSSGGTTDGGGDMCANLGCIDVFDCIIYHAAQFGPCGFTKCDGLICKK